MRRARPEILRDPAHHAGKIQDAQKNEHEANRKLHRKAEARRNNDAEQNDERSDQENCDGMAESPKDADERGAANGALAAHDGSHGDDVISVRRMAHAEKESQRDNRKKRNHRR